MPSVEEMAEAMYEMVKEYHGKRNLKAMDLIKAMKEKFGEDASKPECKKSIRVLVDGGVAYFCASLLPWNHSYVCAVDAATGAVGGSDGARPTYVADLGGGWPMEGALLASETSLVVPQGRVAPLLFERDTGASRGVLKGGGGTRAAPARPRCSSPSWRSAARASSAA